MFASSTVPGRLRLEAGTALPTIVGVLAIVGLLWAIGAVAQGQVERAHARLQRGAKPPAVAVVCAPEQACAGGVAVASQPVAAGVDPKPVPVAYR